MRKKRQRVAGAIQVSQPSLGWFIALPGNCRHPSLLDDAPAALGVFASVGQWQLSNGIERRRLLVIGKLPKVVLKEEVQLMPVSSIEERRRYYLRYECAKRLEALIDKMNSDAFDDLNS